MQFLPKGLEPLAAYSQFVLYKIIPSTTRHGKTDKIPIHPRTGHPVNAQDSKNWLDITTVLQSAQLYGSGHGVGFVFTENDPFYFLDIDNCLLDSGHWSPTAVSLMTLLAGAAVEISSSRRGLHIFGTGIVPMHGCRNESLGLEFYTARRFVALTGDSVVGNALHDCSAVLPQLVQTYFPGGAASAPGDLMQRWEQSLSISHVVQWRGPTNDTDLLAMMLRSESAEAAFTGGVRFVDLWDNNAPALEKKYGTDASAYDVALASLLAFWTGNDAGRMHRFMLQSKLARDKWDRTDYLPRTILYARDMCTTWLQVKETAISVVPVVAPAEAVSGRAITGNTHLTPEAQLQHFKGCTYVTDAHRMLVPGGHLLKPEQFKALYGHRTFAMDYMNEKVSRDAWEAYTQSRANEYEPADTICFKPDELPGTILTRNGRRLANVWWPANTPRTVGNPALFLQHIAKLLPDERDQIILLSYLAAIVQYKGVKFNWAPLIQGVQGNGKSLFTLCVAEAIGMQYSSFPKATQLDGKFNIWMRHKILIGVEDIYVPYGQLEVIEALKPMITGKIQPIEPKGVDMQTEEVCCNFIINSNHKEGLPKSYDDRRFAPFYCRQQEPEHLTRDGMERNGPYFKRLYGWLEQDGYAIVSEFLHTYAIPDEFNPANKQPAPITSSTGEAIEHGRTGIEQEILEAIEQGTPGFRGGWVSSIALNRLLTALRADRRITLARRCELLRPLGYDLHPALPNGRVNNEVQPDGGKPRLYIKRGHSALTFDSPAEIARAYTEAQQYSLTK